MNWSGGGAISHTVAPTTNKTYTANFRTQYYLTMTHGTGGTVMLGSGWKSSGATVSISATAANGYSFSGWTGSGAGFYSGTNNPASITMNGPITETASFTHNPVQVTVQTNPSGLAFAVDGTPYTSAQTFTWVPGSSHTIATTSPQNGATVTPASGWKNSGAAVSIRAMPASGYSFTNWTGSGTDSFSGTTNPASITMGGPITETATFTHN